MPAGRMEPSDGRQTQEPSAENRDAVRLLQDRVGRVHQPQDDFLAQDLPLIFQENGLPHSESRVYSLANEPHLELLTSVFRLHS